MTSTWLLILTVFNLVVLSVLTIQVFLKLKEKKEDQRLAKGLQLLQNKISILQDLSDRTDQQVQRTVQSLENKMLSLQDLSKRSELIESSLIEAMKKATQTQKELAKTSQPPPESNQQHMAMQVQAARLANQGFTREQILEQVNLNPAEVDLILKINKDQLQFAEDELPTWVSETNSNTNSSFSSLSDFEKTLRQQKEKLQLIKDVKTPTAAQSGQHTQPILTSHTTLNTPANQATTLPMTNTPSNQTSKGDKDNIRPFVFKRIDGRSLIQ